MKPSAKKSNSLKGKIVFRSGNINFMSIVLLSVIVVALCLTFWNWISLASAENAQSQKGNVPQSPNSADSMEKNNEDQNKSIDEPFSIQTSKRNPIEPANDGKARRINMAELAKGTDDLEEEDEEPAEADTYLNDPQADNRPVPPDAISPKTDMSASSMSGTSEPQFLVPSPGTSASFQALPDSGTTIPPDTHGAVGPNHVMTVLNSQIRIQNKTGTILSTTTLNAFWATVAPVGGVFDPKVLYDPYSARWLFTACVGQRSANSGVLIGVSQTNDPTGSWLLYNARADSTGVNWADYPSFGFNKDWVVVSLNMFTVSASAFTAARTFVFRKSSIFSGTLGGIFFSHAAGDGFTITPAITYSSTEPTEYFLSSWNGNSAGNGFLRLYTLTGAVGSEVFTPTNIFPNSGGRTWSASAANNFAPQLGAGFGIMTNDNRMQNVVFRNGSLWAAHSVFTPAGSVTRSAVQWWQITPSTGGVSQIGRVEDTSNANFYAFPSIAVNQNNDVLVGYAAFSSSIYGSASYSFRASTDAAGTLRDPATLKSGLGCYIKTFGTSANRWGDYSNTVVDPSDDTSFWTVQEYADPASPVGQCTDGTGRWATWWGKITSSGCGSSTPISVGQNVNGNLQGGDCFLSDNSFYDAYTFNGTAGQQIAISMNSTQFNAYLFLYQGSYPGGNLVTQDNDGGGGTNARIPPTSGVLTLPATGTYTILANSLTANETGSYTLTLSGGVTPSGRKPFDFDGDSRADLSIFRPSNGQWWYQQSSNNVVRAFTFGVSTDKIVPADYDNDGKTDVAVWRPSTGAWFVLRSSNLTFFSAPFGISTDRPMPGDYDGDGAADLTVFRPSQGVWYINKSSGGTQTTPFGTNGDVPQAADYDGDNRADIAIYRPSNGQWWVLRSSNGSVFATTFGISTDKPDPADYTGDGKADVAFWRPSTGQWFVLRSENLTFYAAPFGSNGDIPVAGDYDGDGKADLAVFRPSSVTWFVLKSNGGTLIQSFGATGDIPVPSAFVP